jgi:diacylglycerol kinase family enzyme
LAGGIVRAIDVGVVEYVDRGGFPMRDRFLNVASIGIGGLVDRLVSRSRWKWAGGRVAFAAATARALVQHRAQSVRLRFDGGPEVRLGACGIAFANGRHFGGGMKIAPQAALDDGYLDVVALGDFRLMDFMLKGYRLYSGTHVDLDKVSMCRARTVAVESDEEVLLDIDGESPGVLPVHVAVAPRAINVVVSNGAHLAGVA